MRIELIEKGHKGISIRRQSELLSINRSGIYYEKKGETEFNLSLMRMMDEMVLDDPTLGVIGMVDELKDRGITVNKKRVRRLFGLMNYRAIYPQKSLSMLGEAKYVHPYLLRHLEIIRSNQVWAIDITYIPMIKGFMYLTAIIDIFSRKIMAWNLSNSLHKEVCLDVLNDAVLTYGKPEIINSDQGSQFTSEDWVNLVKSLDIKISMDGKGRAIDNIYIERFWRTIKQRYIYLNPEPNGLLLYRGICRFMNKYNKKRHQGIGRVSPNVKYSQTA